MTNEELAVAIKEGNSILYAELWNQTEPLIRQFAKRYMDFYLPVGVDIDDLTQSAFFALVDAVHYYDPKAGLKLTTYLTLTAKRAFAEACGFRSGRSDAMHRAESYDEPLGNEEKDFTVMDTLEDETALEAIEDVAERAFQDQLSHVLRLALAELEPAERAYLIRRYYMNERRQEAEQFIITEYGIPAESVRTYSSRALKKLDHGKYHRELRELWRVYYGEADYSGSFDSFGGGLANFARTGYSSVESAALKKIERENSFL